MFIDHDVSKEDDKKMSEKSLSVWNVCAMLRNTEGRLLTLIDATVMSEKQRESTKSLIREMLWGPYGEVTNWCLQQTKELESSFPFAMNNPTGKI